MVPGWSEQGTITAGKPARPGAGCQRPSPPNCTLVGNRIDVMAAIAWDNRSVTGLIPWPMHWGTERIPLYLEPKTQWRRHPSTPNTPIHGAT